MKLLITIPDEVQPNYGRIHQTIAAHLGEGGAPGGYPLTIEQTDCPTHPDNYQVLFCDHLSDHEGWRACAVLTFRHRPFVEPPRPVFPPGMDGEAIDNLQCEWQEARDRQFEDEERAIFRQLEQAGYHFASATPPSSYSPTGRGYANAAQVIPYEHHILVTQSGGIDC